MSYDVRLPAVRGMLAAVGDTGAHLPHLEAGGQAWVLRYANEAEARRAEQRAARHMNGGGMDKVEIKLIDWRTVGGITWRAHVCNGDIRWRRWRHWWLEAVACAPGEVCAVVYERPVYPWHMEGV